MMYLLILAAAFLHPQSISNAHAASMEIGIDGSSSCSATAIGPHTLLTAEHCMAGGHSLTINDEPTQVKGIVLDGDDHALVTVSTTFAHLAQFGVLPVVGDSVHVFGNPGSFRDILRDGIVSGHYTLTSRHIAGKTLAFSHAVATIYDLNGFFGDSGSALFNDDGQIVGVISFAIEQNTGQGDTWHAMASLPLAFTAAQMRKAESQ